MVSAIGFDFAQREFGLLRLVEPQPLVTVADRKTPSRISELQCDAGARIGAGA